MPDLLDLEAEAAAAAFSALGAVSADPPAPVIAGVDPFTADAAAGINRDEARDTAEDAASVTGEAHASAVGLANVRSYVAQDDQNAGILSETGVDDPVVEV
ncbi:hypothetical protein E2F47_24985 [Mycobacterium eburneum]|nr:hypothetical protein E2F47_24985 [Mycobacterium eburneum]